MDLMSRANLQAALTAGAAPVVAALTAGLTTDERLATTGIAVLGVRVVAIRADADLERALQTPAREQAQTAADKATNDRRALAVERERTIAENEPGQPDRAWRPESSSSSRRRVPTPGAAPRSRPPPPSSRPARRPSARRCSPTPRAPAPAPSARPRRTPSGPACSPWPTSTRGCCRRSPCASLAGHLPDVGAVNITPDLLTGALTGLLPGAGTDRS
ncbi:hypothetical protein GCM10025868_25810 [Angustibacter aerolatus]|uniref:Uncharacterized protein n=1 Tax=Angustibacter aerolatus TaxID=1162965 RepID=A0ABQ6JIF6_9ACTN|nr:hypothetical protein GCM10025868_25810 [Angustibacter aerolatus]